MLFGYERGRELGDLFRHSKKLAFALMTTSPREVIRIVKNLRTCGQLPLQAKAVVKVHVLAWTTGDRIGSCVLKLF